MKAQHNIQFSCRGALCHACVLTSDATTTPAPLRLDELCRPLAVSSARCRVSSKWRCIHASAVAGRVGHRMSELVKNEVMKRGQLCQRVGLTVGTAYEYLACCFIWCGASLAGMWCASKAQSGCH